MQLKNYFAPRASQTKYQIGIPSSHGELEVYEVTREGSNFYVRKVENEPESANELENELESANEPDFFADIRDLARFLKENNAVWLVKNEKKKLRSRILFLNKQQAMELLRDGVPVFHLESGQIISFSKGYDELLSSVTGTVSELLPGSYMVAVGEPWNPKTYKQVQEENNFARFLRKRVISEPRNTNSYEAVTAAKKEEADEIARLQKANAKLEAERAADAENFAHQNEESRIEAQKLAAENARLKAEAESIARQKKKFNWKTFIGGLALGIGSGYTIKSLIKNI